MKQLAILILLCSVNALACTSDFNCSYGQRCVMPQGEFQGLCITKTDQYGQTAPVQQMQQMNAETVAACYSDYDCGYGNSCIKRTNATQGICIKGR